ncbi:MAG: hypothetical protein LC796_08385, partial [Acidobacteria bacterium]|nr:hypothetical protein [Acidobacteriota bacterium]MCA1610688.1 hypothetical protein [Acidobacteriota bacterium]
GEPAPRPPGREDLRAGRDLMVSAVAYRPGWAMHRFLLGELAYAEFRQDGAAEARRPELWTEPLRLASDAAPGYPAIWVARARAILPMWKDLPAGERDLAPSVVEHAFRDPEFVTEQFAAAAAALGRDAAARLLPSDSDALSRAIRILTREGDVAGVAALTTRWENAERSERTGELALAEERARREDLEELRWRCPNWVYRHPPSELEDPATASQAARILALWPLDREGTWGGDPRTTLTQYFLEGRQSEIEGALLLRVIESLTGVPDTVRARVRALAGDLEAAGDMAARGAAVDRQRWTAVFLEIAKAHFKNGHAREAWLTLEAIAPGDQESCDVLLARRDVARALGNRLELGAVSRALESQKAAVQAQPAWSAQGSLSLCLDPEQTTGQRLSVDLEASAPSFVVWGWDGYSLGRLTVPAGRTTLAIPVTGLTGHRTFSVRTTVGPAVHPGRATFEKESGTASGADGTHGT